MDQLKSTFAQIAISERGDRLRISEDELVQGRLYSSLDAVRLGLADEIGGDSDAFQKAAELAGISHYGLVDVNQEGLRELIKDIERIFPESDDGSAAELDKLLALMSRGDNNGDSVLQPLVGESDSGITRLQAVRELMLY